MKLEKRNDAASPGMPEEAPQEGGQKPVVIYIMILFIAAFLLMAWSFASHQRSNSEALGQIQSSFTAMQDIQSSQDEVIQLQKDLAEAREAIQELEEAVEQRDEKLETLQMEYMAVSQLQALEQMYAAQDYEACRKLIDRFESDHLADHLSSDVSALDQELGVLISFRERYEQLKEAVEVQEDALYSD